MLQGEHSATLSTFIKLPFVIKIFALSIFEWPPKTGFTVQSNLINLKFSELEVYFELLLVRIEERGCSVVDWR